VITKLNATKIFNAGASIATSKRQLLAQKHSTWCIDFIQVGLSFLPFTQLLQNPMLYNPFQSARHLKSVPSHDGIYTPCNTCSLDWHISASQMHLDQFSHFCTSHGRDFLYFTMCIRMQLLCNTRLKTTAAAINATKKLIIWQPIF